MIRTGTESHPRLVGHANSPTLGGFCRIVYKRFGSLRDVSTEKLAKLYHRYFRLPLLIDEEALRKHCEQIGIHKLFKNGLPAELSAYHVHYRGQTIIAVNSNQWHGVHILSAFHELYEVMDRRYSRLYGAYNALRGIALERRANKFAVCILIAKADDVDWPKLFLSVPHLELQLGENIFSTILRRIKDVTAGRYPFLLIHYARRRQHTGAGSLVARTVWFDHSREFLPKRPRRILRAILPRGLEPHTERRLPRCCYDYQGPILVRRDTGFDLFRFHDLSLFCIPVFSAGELSHMFLFGVKATDNRGVAALLHAYQPKVIEELFQQI